MKKLNLTIAACGLLFASIVAGCAGTGGGGGGSNYGGANEKDSSEPINNNEAVEYKRSILRCHKTGGTRIVKIEGELRCF